nr:adhesin [Providencia sp. JUb39]
MGWYIEVSTHLAWDVPGKGDVKCVGRTYEGNGWYDFYPVDSWQRFFIVAPPANVHLQGVGPLYRIADGIFANIDIGRSDSWSVAYESTCANLTNQNSTQSIHDFDNWPDVRIQLFIDRKIIDGIVDIPQTDLLGYVLAFDRSGPPPADFIPITQASMPFRFRQTRLYMDSYCETTVNSGTPGTLELRHGSLNSMEYDSQVSGQITYNCHFSRKTLVNLKLQYATDDAQKRLPLLNSSTQDKIYSELTMEDESTGMSGTNFDVNIETLKTITVRSHLKGKNATAGNYHGSAILIATMK